MDLGRFFAFANFPFCALRDSYAERCRTMPNDAEWMIWAFQLGITAEIAAYLPNYDFTTNLALDVEWIQILK